MTSEHTPKQVSADDIREMLDGLEGVTPGPWLSAYWAGSPSTGLDAGILNGPKMVARDKSVLHTPADAAHIARCDPDTMRQVLTLALDALTRRSSAGVKGLPAARLHRRDGLGPVIERLDASWEVGSGLFDLYAVKVANADSCLWYG